MCILHIIYLSSTTLSRPVTSAHEETLAVLIMSTWATWRQIKKKGQPPQTDRASAICVTKFLARVVGAWSNLCKLSCHLVRSFGCYVSYRVSVETCPFPIRVTIYFEFIWSRSNGMYVVRVPRKLATQRPRFCRMRMRTLNEDVETETSLDMPLPTCRPTTLPKLVVLSQPVM